MATQINGNNVSINAGRDLNIATANESASARDQHQYSSSGILSGSTTQTNDASSRSNQIGSTFSGNTTLLAAVRNANITAATW